MLPIGSSLPRSVMHQSMVPFAYSDTHSAIVRRLTSGSGWVSHDRNLVTSGSDIQFLNAASASSSLNLLSWRRSVRRRAVPLITKPPRAPDDPTEHPTSDLRMPGIRKMDAPHPFDGARRGI